MPQVPEMTKLTPERNLQGRQGGIDNSINQNQTENMNEFLVNNNNNMTYDNQQV